MKCQRCGANEAVFHYKGTAGGKPAEFHLCPGCAREMGAEAGLPPSSCGPFGALLDPFGPWRGAPAAKGPVCPLCGATQRTIADSGKAGCAQCYATFQSLFDPFVRRIHGDARHSGKIPAAAGAQLHGRRALERLREELKQAVALQNYEEAALLRDRIRELEGGSET